MSFIDFFFHLVVFSYVPICTVICIVLLSVTMIVKAGNDVDAIDEYRICIVATLDK